MIGLALWAESFGPSWSWIPSRRAWRWRARDAMDLFRMMMSPRPLPHWDIDLTGEFFLPVPL